MAVAPTALGESEGPLLELVTPVADFGLVRVPDTETLCSAGALLRFRLARPARVTLAVAGETATGAVDSGPARSVFELPLGSGAHEIVVSGGPREGLVLGERPFSLAATEGNGGARVIASGTLRDERLDRAVLPVGRTFVSGVDLLDGHLVLQSTDLKLEGRHLALEITRTYSSAGRSPAGLAGAGWRLNYESAAIPLPSCDLVLVRTADGSAQAFVGTGGTGFRPERAYHTRLQRHPDGGFDFVDKAAVRHHFAERMRGTAASLRLAWIEEPHGDRIVLTYDAEGRLRQASEWHPLLGPVRTLAFSPSTAGGADRVASVHAWGLGLRVDFRYDEWGNLVAATRTDREGGSATDGYEYTASDPGDRHQLASAAPYGEKGTTYAYGPPSDSSKPGVEQGSWWDPRDAVREVAPPNAPVTRLTYDRSAASKGRLRTDVRSGDDAETRYILNADGNPIEIDEPAGVGRRVTHLQWDHNNVVKTGEQHADGRTLRWAYDNAGNLVLEREVAGHGAPERTTAWTYDERFNILVHKVDAEGRHSRWTLDPRTGDPLKEELPDGTTAWAYDDAGCLREQRNAEGRTLFRRPDTFCNATEVHAPDGSVVRRRYDARGRLMDETTSPPK